LSVNKQFVLFKTNSLIVHQSFKWPLKTLIKLSKTTPESLTISMLKRIINMLNAIVLVLSNYIK